MKEVKQNFRLHVLIIKALLLLSHQQAVVASNTGLNPFAIGLRSAISSNKSFGNGISNSRRSFSYTDDDFNSFDKWCGDEKDTYIQKQNLCEVENVSTVTTKQVNKPKFRGGATTPSLTFYENMICGAVSRSIAQVATHPANTMKTLLQSNRNKGSKITIKTLAKPSNAKMLTRGAGAQFLLSIPHGAVNFAVLEYVRKQMNNVAMKSAWASEKLEDSPAFKPLLDFCSSAIATVCCSAISTPQMMIVDNIMAGTYENFPKAIVGLSRDKGIMGFYGGWWPGLVGKIPSYVSYCLGGYH